MKNYFEEEKDKTVHTKYAEWDEHFKDQGLRIAICIPTYDLKIHIPTMVSLMTMWKPEHYILEKLGPTIGVNRNNLVERALANNATTHILFVDTDMILPHDMIARFLKFMESDEVDMMTAIYFQKNIPFRSTQFLSFTKDKFKRLRAADYDEGELVKIHSSGAGAVLIKREVFDKIEKPYFKFILSKDGTKYIGEDIYFFRKAAEAGLNLYVDTSIIAQHMNGSQIYPLMFEQDYLRIGAACKKIGENQDKESVIQWLGL
jgi:predicted peroxiredoxin